jgi:hypothetical protein
MILASGSGLSGNISIPFAGILIVIIIAYLIGRKHGSS